MIFAAAEFKNRAAIFEARCLRTFDFHGFKTRRRNINRRRGICRNFNLPIEFISIAVPFDGNFSVRRVVGGLHKFQITDRRRAHDDVFESRCRIVRRNAGEVFVKPHDEIADEHDVIAVLPFHNSQIVVAPCSTM